MKNGMEGALRARSEVAATGCYLMTLTSAGRAAVFGHCLDGRTVQPSAIGRILAAQVKNLARWEPDVSVRAVAVLPNHIHILLRVREGAARPDFARLSAGIKARAEGEYAFLTGRGQPNLWDRGYRALPLSTERELARAEDMVRADPENWRADEYYIPPAPKK